MSFLLLYWRSSTSTTFVFVNEQRQEEKERTMKTGREKSIKPGLLIQSVLALCDYHKCVLIMLISSFFFFFFLFFTYIFVSVVRKWKVSTSN